MIYEALIVLAATITLVLHAAIERYRRRPRADCNPHSHKYRTGDMAASFWIGHFDLLHSEMRETRSTQQDILAALTEIKTILRERPR